MALTSSSWTSNPVPTPPFQTNPSTFGGPPVFPSPLNNAPLSDGFGSNPSFNQVPSSQPRPLSNPLPPFSQGAGPFPSAVPFPSAPGAPWGNPPALPNANCPFPSVSSGFTPGNPGVGGGGFSNSAQSQSNPPFPGPRPSPGLGTNPLSGISSVPPPLNPGPFGNLNFPPTNTLMHPIPQPGNSSVPNPTNFPNTTNNGNLPTPGFNNSGGFSSAPNLGGNNIVNSGINNLNQFSNNPLANNTSAGNNPSLGNNTGTGGFSNAGFGPKNPLHFVPNQIKEEANNLTILNICAMPEVAGRSLEEQRFQDYKLQDSTKVSSMPPNPMCTSRPPPGISSAGLFSNPSNSSAGNNSYSQFKPQEVKPATPLTNTGGSSLFGNSNQTSLLFPSNTGPPLFNKNPGPVPTQPHNNPSQAPQIFPTNAHTNPPTPNLPAATSIFSNNSNQVPQPGPLFATSSSNPTPFSNPPIFSNPTAFANPTNTSNTNNFSNPPTFSNPTAFSNPTNDSNTTNFSNPQQNGFSQPVQHTDYLSSAYKDPHGLSWLYPEAIPEVVMKSYGQRAPTHIAAESTSVVERIVKPKRINNYPQVLTEKWKNSQEKSYLKPDRGFDMSCHKKSGPFFIAKRPSFLNLKLEEYKDEDNSRYFRIPGNTATKAESLSEILVVAHDPNPIRMVIPVTTATTIKEVKYHVSKHITKVENSNLQLVYKSKILVDSDTIKSAGIVQNSELAAINVPGFVGWSRDMVSDEMLPVVGTGYRIRPSLVEMARMTVEQLKKVKNFSVENKFGKLEFEGSTNVLGLNLKEILKINLKEVIGYPDDGEIEKPEIGMGLNKPAVLTLYQYEVGGNKEKVENKLKTVCQRANMEFINYDYCNQQLQVRIKHF